MKMTRVLRWLPKRKDAWWILFWKNKVTKAIEARTLRLFILIAPALASLLLTNSRSAGLESQGQREQAGLFEPGAVGGSKEFSHLTKNVSFPGNKTNVIVVSEHDGPAVWNLSAEVFDLLIVIFVLRFNNLLGVFSLRLGQGFNPAGDFLSIETPAFGTYGAGGAVTDGEKSKRWCLNFAVFVRFRICAFYHRVDHWARLLSRYSHSPSARAVR